MNKKDFPKIHFYDQDFVDIYDRTWSLLQDFWYSDVLNEEDVLDGFFLYPDKNTDENVPIIIDQFESIFSSFFIVYSNRNYPAGRNLNFFYEQQESNGAIRCKYDFKTKQPLFSENNKEGLGLPLFAWAEFNLYHKSANKKRIKEVMPFLQKYMNWLENFKSENGLYQAPVEASTMYNSPRTNAKYLIDFNAAVAINALYMSTLGDILNDKDLSFLYKRQYFSLKTRINSLMWDEEARFYFDLDEHGNRLPCKTIAGFWPLLAEIPNEDKADSLVKHLTNPTEFGTDHPFPTLSADDPHFCEDGDAFRGSVYSPFTYMVIKGLEKYQRWDIARESVIRHLYFVLEALFPDEDSPVKGSLWEAYMPTKTGAAKAISVQNFPKQGYIQYTGLSTIAMMIENVIGLSISLPRKTVDWIIPNLEIMGIENLALKRNMITILSNKSQRGWEIHMESEKLYYFTINILGQKKKTLPIPSGKCSMLIDKL